MSAAHSTDLAAEALARDEGGRSVVLATAIVRRQHRDALPVTAARFILGGRLLLAGTGGGALYVYRLSADAATGEERAVLVSRQQLHSDAVHVIAVSTTLLVATGGHDASCSILQLSDLIGPATTSGSGSGGPRVRRLSCHELPVLDAAFLLDGRTLLSLSADGAVVVADAVSGAVRLRLRCGFPCRAMALSPDETVCFVGGKMIGRVDLLHALRLPAEQHLSSAPYEAQRGGAVDDNPLPWLRLCCWRGPADDGDAAAAAAASAGTSTRGEAAGALRRVHVAAANTTVARLHVAAGDGALTALFSQRLPTGEERPVAAALWRFGGATAASVGSLLADNYATIPPSATTAAKTTTATTMEASSLSSAAATTTTTTAGPGAHIAYMQLAPETTWAAVERSVAAPPKRQRDSAAADAAAAAVGGAASARQRLQDEQVEHELLRMECDALAEQLRDAVERKRTRV